MFGGYRRLPVPAKMTRMTPSDERLIDLYLDMLAAERGASREHA